MITTSTGTTVEIVEDTDGERLVMIDHPDAPADMRHHTAGRVVEGFGFQPAPFAVYGLRPETLRAIADLLEGGN